MKGAALKFEAATNIPPPYEVYWQVVNTGNEATAAGQLRGGFDKGTVERGSITHREATGHSGAYHRVLYCEGSPPSGTKRCICRQC
jgi:hypothetical protein